MSIHERTSFQNAGRPDETWREIADNLLRKGELTSGDLATMTGSSVQSVKSNMSGYKARGWVNCTKLVGYAIWSLTEKGKKRARGVK